MSVFNKNQKNRLSFFKRLTGYTLIFLIISAGLRGTVSADAPEENGKIRHIILLHTNDQHFQFNHLNALKAKIARFRNEYENVFLFDAGDIAIRPTYWLNIKIIKKDDKYQEQLKAIINIMNSLGYNALTLGNHELGYHTTVTRDILRTAKFPILGANVKVTTKNFDQPKPFIMLETSDGLTLAVLGLSGGKFDDAEGISLSDELSIISEYTHLREKCNAFVLLTHLGTRIDQSIAEKYGEMVDVIIGGHSHTQLNPPEFKNGVLIAQANVPYRSKQYLGVILLTFAPDGSLLEKKGEVLTFNTNSITHSNFLKQPARSTN